MAITYQAHGHTSVVPATTSWTFTPDAGTLAGDAFLVSVFTQDAYSDITPPTGSFGTPVNNENMGTSGDNRVSVFVWFAPTDTPGPVSIGVSASAQGTVSWVRFRGVDRDAPIDASGKNTHGGGPGSWEIQAPSITTTGPDRMIVGGWSADGGGSVTSVTGPSGWTTYNGTITPRKGALAVKGIQANAGSTGMSGTWTVAPDNAWAGNRVAFQIALTPGDYVPDPDPGPDPSDAKIAHAVVGAWKSDGFTVTAKAEGAASARLKVGSNAAVTSAVAYSSWTTVDTAGYVTLTISGLPARTRDYYLIELLDASGTPSASTLLGSPSRIPGAGAPWSGRIAWGSCYHSHRAEISSVDINGAYPRISAKNPDLFFHLGDWDYWDNDSTSVAEHRWDMEEPFRLSSALRSLTANVPTFYMKSDHDGDAGERGVGPWTAPNRQATLQMFPYAPDRPDPNGLYYATTVGRVRFIFSDTRYLGTVDTTRLGPVQMAWLKAEFERPEPLKIWVQDSIWITDEPPASGEDDWANHHVERAELGQHWEQYGVGTMIGLHGDQHALSADDGSGNQWGGFPTFCAAPFRNTSSQKTLSQSKWSNGFWPTQTGTPSAQYGILDLTDNGQTITAVMRGYDTQDTVRVSMTVTVEETVGPPAEGVSASALTNPAGRWVKSPMRGVWHDGSAWRAIMPTGAGHRLDTLAVGGAIEGPILDDRQSARLTGLAAGGQTYILAGHQSASRLTVLNALLQQVRTSTVPLTSANLDASPITLHRSPNGHLWAAVMDGVAVRVTRSTDDGATWSPAVSLVTQATTGTVAFFQAGTTVGLIATGNDGVGRWVRTIGQAAGSIAAGSWATETLPALSAPLTSDDHLSVLSLPDGRVLMATKTTGSTGASQMLLHSLMRSTSGVWSALGVIEGGPDDIGYTRPTLTLAGSLVVVHYGNYQAGQDQLWRRTLNLNDASPVWSARTSVLPGPGRNDSANAPLVAPAVPWPIASHRITDGSIQVSWQTLWADAPGPGPGPDPDPEPDTPMYVGTRRVVEVRVGDVDMPI